MRTGTDAGGRSGGFTLIEVLVAITVVVIGLLGLAGMQARAQIAEFESYQRAQALVLLYDMMDRLQNNRATGSCFAITNNAAAGTPYVGDTTGGGHYTVGGCAVSTTQNNLLADGALAAWEGLLQGTAEKKGAGAANVGAMIGARGCIYYASATEYQDATGAAITGTGEYTIVVAWQGIADTFAPTKACGNNLYGTESKRRTVWATMRMGTLKAQ